MQIIETALPEVKLIVPDVFGDERGYFQETWNAGRYDKLGIRADWVQDNESCSRYGVLRGLHFQKPPFTQAKLVRVIQGAVWDVAVDIRKNSPTFGKHVAVELNGENKYQLFIPKGFAHGFAVLSERVLFAYKCDAPYSPAHERGIAFDDPALGIYWKIDMAKVILSPKDKLNPLFKDAEFSDDYAQGEIL
jgi:dTDP-4-dehydrorhamnose 3,5-epimerase